MGSQDAFCSRFAVLALALTAASVCFNTAVADTEVGSITGQFSVSPLGAATYSIPLKLPPGAGGMTPQIGLVYNSQAPDTFIGPGWAVSGLSQIARCPANYADDGYSGSIQFNGNDRFCLDGQRLVTSGTYGAVGAQYRTQIESFSQITSVGGTVGNPAYFVVKTKSGLTMTYGQSPAAQFTKKGDSTKVLVWLLQRTQDTTGNYIDYTYNLPVAPTYDGAYYPNTISYGGNLNQGTPDNEVVTFNYTSYSGYYHNGYVAGQIIDWSNELSYITVNVGGATVRTWTLNYRFPTGQTGNEYTTFDRVEPYQLVECGSKDGCSPPTAFGYGQANNQGVYSAGGSGSLGGSNFTKQTGDFNGDGKADLIGFEADSNGTGHGFVWLGGNSVPSPITWSAPAAYGGEAAFGDFNGDGLMDVAWVSTGVINNSCVVNLTVFYSTKTSVTSSTYANLGQEPTALCKPGFSGSPPTATPPTAVFAGDFDGDGRTDILIYYVYTTSCFGGAQQSNYVGQKIALTGNQYVISGAISYGVSGCTQGTFSPTVLSADINGDGIQDLVFVQPGSGITTYPGGNATSFSEALPSSTFGLTPTLADLNADGFPELIFFGQSGSTGFFYALLNDGTGNYISSSINHQTFNLPGSDSYIPVVGDFNGDGYNDVAWVEGGTGNHTAEVYLSLGLWGSSFFDYEGATFGSSNGNKITAFAADTNGDGLNEILVWNGDTYSGEYFVPYALANPYLNYIYDGFGATVRITYKPLTDSTVYSDDGAGIGWPVKPLRIPEYVVASTQVTNPGYSDRIVNYSYKDARIHAQGRGFLGFSQVNIDDTASRLKQISRYSQAFPQIGLVTSQQIIDDNNSLTTAQSSTTYATSGPSTYKSYFVYPSASTAQSFEISSGTSQVVTTTTTSNTYDTSYGNLTNSTVTVYSGTAGSSPSYTTQTSNTYESANTANWFIGRLSRTQITRSATGTPSITRTSSFNYDSTTGLLSEEIVEPNSANTTLYLDTKYQRDAFGNITTTTVSGYQLATRTTTNQFYSSSPYFGRYKTQACNALNQCHNYTYDVATGNVLTDTDANNVVTSYQYDGLDRPAGTTISQSGGLNVSTTITRQLCSATGNLCNGVVNGYFYVETSKSDGSAEVEVYNRSERVVRKATKNGDGTWIEVLSQYDAVGRPYKVSSPRTSTASASETYWTTTLYDDLGRPKQITAPHSQSDTSGSVTKFTYNGLTTTITDALGHQTTKVMTATGKLALVTDASGGTVNYTYDAFDNLLTAKDAAGHTTSLVYDTRGRKTQMTDPDMGTWHYVYDALGELTSQTDAKGKVISMAYDLLGRMTSRTEAEDTTTWTYDTLWKGALYQAKVMSGSTQKYLRTLSSPTPFGAMKTQTTIIDGTSYTFTFAYDNQGRVTQITYPQGFSVKQSYNGNGAEYQLSDPSSGKVYWQANDWDNWGKVADEAYGNGVDTGTYRDLAVGKISAIIGGSGNGIVNLAYQWDAVGNAAMREDYNQSNRTEYFCYDALNRLTYVQTQACGGTSGRTIALAYDGLGNIKSKTGIGGYTYSGISAGPHAVTAAGNNTYAYDADGNLTQVKLSGALIRSYTWASYNLPTVLTNNSTGSSSTFEYGPDREKVRQTIMQSGSSTTINYVGGGLFEAYSGISGTAYKNYLVAPTGVIAVVTQSSGSADAIAYFHHDNLGSVAAQSDANGNLVFRTWYDAFGQQQVIAGRLGTPWGYIGQLELSNLNLIHLNGRVYDPVIGRFLSPDPNIQAPDNLQSLNRYSYCWNNPLTFTDPSGYFLSGFFHWLGHHFQQIVAIVVAVVAAYFGQIEVSEGIWTAEQGTVFAAFAGFDSGLISSNGNIEAGLIDAATAAAFFGAGQYFDTLEKAPGVAENPTEYYEIEAGRIITHGAIGGVSSVASGGKFGAGVLSTVVPDTVGGFLPATDPHSFTGLLVGTVENAVLGGTGSVLGGGKFANGAMTASFAYLFNQAMGDVQNRAQQLNNQDAANATRVPDLIYDPVTGDLYRVNENGDLVQSWSADSGPWGNGPLPNGDYTIGNVGRVPSSNPQQASYCDAAGNCWFAPLKPQFSTTRIGLGIHPDGGVPGTLGCVGVTTPDTSQLYNALRTMHGGTLQVGGP